MDAGNPVVYLIPKEIELMATGLPREVNGIPEVLRHIEKIRSIAAEMIGIVLNRNMAISKSPAYPKIGFVSAPTAM